jgi:hypothetical protein
MSSPFGGGLVLQPTLVSAASEAIKSQCRRSAIMSAA